MVQDKTGSPPTGGGTPHTPDPPLDPLTPSSGASAPTAPSGRGVRESGRVLMARVAAAAAGGGLLFLAFPPIDWWLAAPIGVGLIVAALYRARPRRAAWLGYLAAAVFLFPTLAWVRTIGDDVWVMLVGVESLFYAVMAALAALVFRLPLWPLWFGGLWVAMEWARGLFPVGGFPWARLAFSQGESLFTEYAALGGAPLVSFAVALCGALLARAVLRRPPDARRVAGRLVPVAVALAVPLLTLAIPRPGDEGRSVNLGIVQGNVPRLGAGLQRHERRGVLDNHVRRHIELAADVAAGQLAAARPGGAGRRTPATSTRCATPAPRADHRRRPPRTVGVPILVGAVLSMRRARRTGQTRSLVGTRLTGPGA